MHGYSAGPEDSCGMDIRLGAEPLKGELVDEKTDIFVKSTPIHSPG